MMESDTSDNPGRCIEHDLYLEGKVYFDFFNLKIKCTFNVD